MKTPQNPPPYARLLEEIGRRPGRLEAAFGAGLRPEWEGQYLHWDEVRRRPPPPPLETDEWWLGLSTARRGARTELALTDASGGRWSVCSTDSLHRLLHHVDRALGAPIEVSEPGLVNRDLRDRYLQSSLMEEAITSSQLEGASTTRQVAREMLLSGRRPVSRDERMIANNFRAMQFLRGKTEQPLTLPLLRELHEVLMEGTLAADEVGRWRTGSELITVVDQADGAVLHTPPPAEELDGRLSALCEFANGATGGAFVHPVVRAIALHFALAYEHPFVDGNGRTARALFYWSMLQQRYWLAEFLSISRVIRQAPSQYVRAFLFVESGERDLTYFVLHQLEVLRTATRELHEYLERKTRELKDTDRWLRDDAAFNHRQRAVLAHALRHPEARYTVESHRREHAVVTQTARTDLLGLAEAGLLEKKQRGRAFVFEPAKGLERRLKRL